MNGRIVANRACQRALLIAGALLTAATAFAESTTATTDQPPNFVFFLVDDMGLTDVGCYGSTFYETPNIDALAASGAKFTSAYAACPVCSPSRAAFLTGKYPPRTGVTDYLGSPQPHNANAKQGKRPPHKLLPAEYTPELDVHEVTIAEALKQHGYRTFMAGKWHLGYNANGPENQGFDVVQVATKTRGDEGSKGGPQTDKITSAAIDFIGKSAGKPFFVYLPYYAVHRPVIGRPDLVKKYEAKRKKLSLTEQFGTEGDAKELLNQCDPGYAAMVEEVDESIGSILKAIRDAGTAENTVVIFTSDNGGLSSGNGAPTANLGVRAGKGWLYEGGIRVPLLVHWPGVTRPGSQIDTPVIGTDFYPTLLEMAKLPLIPEQHRDGVSLASVLKSDSATLATQRPLFWHFPHYGANNGGKPGSAIRLGKWKLIKWYESNSFELFDLEADPEEKQDVAAENSAVAKDLSATLEAWVKEVGGKLPSPNPVFSDK